MEIPAATTVKEAVSAGTVLNHLRNNRLEYIGLTIILHLLGVSNLVFEQVSGVCF